MENEVTVHRLGRVEYADGLELQRQFIDARRAGLVTDTLLLLEHPPVLTLGRGAKGQNILASPEALASMGVEVFETDRGGDVTYHGPGQLVGYPLLHLGPGRQDVRRYVRSIEEVILRAVADFGIAATRLEPWPGVWVAQSRAGGPRKLCALGVHLSRWYTRHGFALNVDPDLTHFGLIVPCGIREAGVTSLAEELGRAVAVAEVAERVAHHFGEVFESTLRSPPPPLETVSVAVVRGPHVLLLERAPDRGGYWQLVTGRVEPGESPLDAATRELREETGLALPVEPLDYAHSFPLAPRRDAEERPIEAPRVGHETAFVARAGPEARERLSAEHARSEWLPRDAALARVPHEGLREAVRRALRD